MKLSHAEIQASARAEAFAMPIEEIDPGTPAYFENDTVGHYFERLRRDDPVHHCNSALYGSYWSVTRFQDIMQPPLLVPELQKASALLEEFRRTGNHAGFVVDEFGGVTGMVTLIDLMEAIVGDVPSKEERLTMPVKQRQDGSWLIDGLFEIEKVEDVLAGFRAPAGAGDEFLTLAGWFAPVFERVPAEGDQIEESGWRFEIMDMDGSRVDKVLAVLLPSDPDGISSTG
jgi:CBS domain containing-hemolysin-like protein